MSDFVSKTTENSRFIWIMRFLRDLYVPTSFATDHMYNQHMVVYGELLFIENMIIGGVLLYLTGEICGHGRRRSLECSRYLGRFRFAAGSMMCGAFSLVIFLDAKAPIMLLMEVVFAACVCTVVFGCRRRSGKSERLPDKLLNLKLPWQQVASFILITYFMGGIVMGILLVTKKQGIHTAVGIYTGDMKAAMLALLICLGYMTIKQIVKTMRNKKLYTEHTYEAEIVIGEHIIKASAFLDTGNRLKDPMTGKPVAVASERFWNRLAEEMLQETARFALVPYEAVGTKGLMYAVRTDNIEIAGKKSRGCLIARGERTFMAVADGTDNTGCVGNGYDLLISGEMVE